MKEATWARWRAAETKLASSGDANAAASGLPERQAWILRATAALEAGSRAALEDLLATAPSLELAAALDLALSPPGELDPTRWRASLKREGVRNAPLPRLDLLRLACVAHNGERPTRPQGLANAASDRPVLEAACMVLSKRFKAYKVEALLLARSPRMASFWAAGIAQHLTNGGDVRKYVHLHMRGVEPLPREPWPDLDEPIVPRGVRPPSASLADFLRDPLGKPWSALCSQQARWLSTRGDRTERLATLGAMLDAIDALVKSAAPQAAIPVVDAALTLAEASPEVRQREVLFNQLYLLDMRLRWASSEVEPEMLEPLWSGLHHLPAAERAQCAQSILEIAEELPASRELRAEVLAFAALSGADWKQDVLPWLVVHGRNADLRVFHAVLRDAPAPLRELALGYLHAIHGSAVEAYRLAARMFERGGRDDATQVALACLARCHGAAPRGRQERRLLARAILELARAAAASTPPPSAEFVVALAGMAGAARDETHREELSSALLSCARQRLALPPAERQADLLSRLQLMTLMGLEVEAQTAFRDFGRWLRRARAEESIPGALRLCAELCPDEETVFGYDLEQGAPPSSAGRDPRPAWMHSLTTWLDHHDTETVARHARTLAREHPSLTNGLAIWFLEVSELESTETWDEVTRMSESEADEPDLAEFILNELGGALDIDDVFP